MLVQGQRKYESKLLFLCVFCFLSLAWFAACGQNYMLLCVWSAPLTACIEPCSFFLMQTQNTCHFPSKKERVNYYLGMLDAEAW
jgi:hypothetical protein